jgi:hypothetical protein
MSRTCRGDGCVWLGQHANSRGFWGMTQCVAKKLSLYAGFAGCASSNYTLIHRPQPMRRHDTTAMGPLGHMAASDMSQCGELMAHPSPNAGIMRHWDT